MQGIAARVRESWHFGAFLSISFWERERRDGWGTMSAVIRELIHQEAARFALVTIVE
jgi:hypothetical protein